MSDAPTLLAVGPGIDLGVEAFGDPSAATILLLGAPTMLSWPDALCEALAREGTRVVRCDLRGSGASTPVDLDTPDITLRDLAADAAALSRGLGGSVHLAGIGVSGMVAQVAALDHPEDFRALTLIGTRPVAPGPIDPDLPDHDGPTMQRLFSAAAPEWTDRADVMRHAAEGARVLGDDPEAAAETAGRIHDRTPGSDAAMHMADQSGIIFSRLDCAPRWRDRLPAMNLPTLVVHGRDDPFFPVGNGEALAREIPGARLLVLDGVATAIPETVARDVAAAMAGLGQALENLAAAGTKDLTRCLPR